MVASIQEYRILVVDDDEILNSLFCTFLESRGFEPVAAYSVAEARSILNDDNNIDLALLDYQLGDGVGWDLLSEEAIAHYASMPPVIMISANEDPEFLERRFDKGAADYIIKPVNLSLLALKVKALVNSVRLQRIISSQKIELEKFKAEAEREEAIAKFTYEYLVAQNSQNLKGVNQYLQSCSSFSGDIAISRVSPSGDVYFILADATGHGLSAAITIMPVVTIFNSMVSKGFHLQQVVAEINHKLVNDTPSDRFVAAIVVELNFTKMEIAIWNGAMPTAYWLDDENIIEKFPSKHMAFGILDENTFDADVVVFPMPRNGKLFMCSDGLIEQENLIGEQFSKIRLEKILQLSNEDPIDRLLPALEAHAKSNNYADDVSICTLEPSLILQDRIEKEGHQILGSNEDLHPFTWSIKICGQKLAQADLPPMANGFLQFLGFDQKTCQKVFSVISEMVCNGLDHGILKLSSELKQEPEGFMDYFLKRESLLSELTDDDFIELRLDCLDVDGNKKLMISCKDSGKGYDFEADRQVDSHKYSGRGLALIRSLTESLEIYAPGNFIEVIM